MAYIKEHKPIFISDFQAINKKVYGIPVTMNHTTNDVNFLYVSMERLTSTNKTLDKCSRGFFSTDKSSIKEVNSNNKDQYILGSCLIYS